MRLQNWKGQWKIWQEKTYIIGNIISREYLSVYFRGLRLNIFVWVLALYVYDTCHGLYEIAELSKNMLWFMDKYEFVYILYNVTFEAF